jgi:hypothetical protein
MVIGHNTKDARYILTGNSIEDLEKGLAEMKRQIAAGITFSVCYGGDKSELENDDPNDDCNDCEYDIIDSYGNYDSEYECEEDDNWDICYEDEEENEVKEEVDKDKAIVEMTEEIIAVIKDILGM